MSEVLKVVFVAFTHQYIQSNLTHVRGVKSSSIYTIRAVMQHMSKVLKEAQNGLEHFCSFLNIQLIFNPQAIPSNAMYVKAYQRC